jgi:hypothetical protein
MRRLTHEEFIKRVNERYPELRITSQYRNTRTPVQARCSKRDALGKQHGTFTIRDVSGFLYGKNNRNGCKKCANDSRSLAKTQHFYDYEFFKLPELNNSYWAGFIAADGCVENNKQVSIKLSKKDKSHLILFQQHINHTGELYYGERTSNFGSERVYGYSVLYLSNAQKWIYDLRNNFNIGPRKSLTYTHPVGLTDEQSLAFIKGYIDGDGHVRASGNRIRIGAVGTFNTLTWIQAHFDQLVPAQSSNGLVAKPRKIKNCRAYYYEIGYKRAENIITVLQNLPTPELSRKWK